MKMGFGWRPVERLLAAELNGRSTNSYDPTGVVCEIDAALDIDCRLRRQSGRMATTDASHIDRRAPGPPLSSRSTS
jgi:hypothetical protein